MPANRLPRVVAFAGCVHFTDWPAALSLLSALVILSGGCGGTGTSGGGGGALSPQRPDIHVGYSDDDGRYAYVAFVKRASSDESVRTSCGSEGFSFGGSDEHPEFELTYDPSCWGTVTIAGKSYWLPNGRVFLCDATGTPLTVRRLRIHLPQSGNGHRDSDVFDYLMKDPRVAAFVGPAPRPSSYDRGGEDVQTEGDGGP